MDENLREAIRLLREEGWNTYAGCLGQGEDPGVVAWWVRHDLRGRRRAASADEGRALALLDILTKPSAKPQEAPVCAGCGAPVPEGSWRECSCGTYAVKHSVPPDPTKPVGGQGEGFPENRLRRLACDAYTREGCARLALTLLLVADWLDVSPLGVVDFAVSERLETWPCHPDTDERSLRDQALRVLRGES